MNIFVSKFSELFFFSNTEVTTSNPNGIYRLYFNILRYRFTDKAELDLPTITVGIYNFVNSN